MSTTTAAPSKLRAASQFTFDDTGPLPQRQMGSLPTFSRLVAGSARATRPMMTSQMKFFRATLRRRPQCAPEVGTHRVTVFVFFRYLSLVIPFSCPSDTFHAHAVRTQANVLRPIKHAYIQTSPHLLFPSFSRCALLFFSAASAVVLRRTTSSGSSSSSHKAATAAINRMSLTEGEKLLHAMVCSRLLILKDPPLSPRTSLLPSSVAMA